ncbi:histidine phosphatase family protein [Solicola gregarius]|uniref:Histidine phosphatase family protein n=1 Tax=Solicola gregarius TaxID=2908642 RepID=A0AA46TLL0_9ACTN|nr:histidine phosphatase family protein [Solicola gregarius]UYM07172.1 histidine phosphatase family protein [Solicola gregarius]
MSLVVLVRHGQASWGAADYDVLSEHGHAQARSLGASWRTSGFEPTQLVSGRMRRHRETADEIRVGYGAAPPYDVVDGLEEFDHVDVFAESIGADGSLPDLDASAMEQMFGEGLRRWITADGSRTYRETYRQFRARVGDAFAGLLGRFDADDKAVVVTSGGVIAAIVCDLLGVDDERWPALAAPIINTSTHKVLVRDARPMLVSFNEHAHLATADITYA